jgi:L-lactate dehydrogenase complex protein LldG
MNTREKILSAVRMNQPAPLPLPELDHYTQTNPDLQQHFIAILTAIGGYVHVVNNTAEMITVLEKQFPIAGRKMAINEEWKDYATIFSAIKDPHELNDVDIGIIDAHFGVAENGSLWVTEDQMGLRAFPFICQHLVAVISAKNIVPTMLEAYEKIGLTAYGFGVFIAGPSKTADIEQSLVLGAHGPKTMTVFLKDEG